MRWWRAYSGAVNNPKLARLTDAQHRTWFNLCCLACERSGDLPALDDLAFLLRMPAAKLKKIMAELVAAKMMVVTGNGWRPHDWDEYQYSSDSSAERVRRYRAKASDRSGSGDVAFHVTLQGCDEKRSSNALDTEQNRTEGESAPTRAPARGSRIPENWCLGDEARAYAVEKGLSAAEIEREAEKFLNHFRSASGANARKTDWSATWRKWVLGAIDRRPKLVRPAESERRTDSYGRQFVRDHTGEWVQDMGAA